MGEKEDRALQDTLRPFEGVPVKRIPGHGANLDPESIRRLVQEWVMWELSLKYRQTRYESYGAAIEAFINERSSTQGNKGG